jgi:hypothetical protein
MLSFGGEQVNEPPIRTAAMIPTTIGEPQNHAVPLDTGLGQEVQTPRRRHSIHRDRSGPTQLTTASLILDFSGLETDRLLFQDKHLEPLFKTGTLE